MIPPSTQQTRTSSAEASASDRTATSPTTCIVGLDYYTPIVVELSELAGAPITYAVDDREGINSDPYRAQIALSKRGISFLTTDEFVQLFQSFTGRLNLISGRIECQLSDSLENDPYQQVRAWIQRVVGEHDLQHPVRLLQRVPPKHCPNRYALFGFPGSGNILVQNLIDAILPDVAEPFEWQNQANLSEHYFESVATCIQSLLKPLSPTKVDFIPHHFGTMMVPVKCEPDLAAVAFGVPCPRHFGVRAYPSHSNPTREAVDYFATVQAPCVAVVRHPLETLLSQANKLALPARVMLDDPLFLDQASDQLVVWTRHLLANRERVHVVRYEDVTERHRETLQELAHWLGQSLSDRETDSLFDRFLNRNLPRSVPTHFFKGGSDKWKMEFTPADLARVLPRLPREVFEPFGYPIPTAADLSVTLERETGMTRKKDELFACQLEAQPRHPVPGVPGIQICGKESSLVRAMIVVFQNPELLALFRAAAGVYDSRWPESS